MKKSYHPFPLVGLRGRFKGSVIETGEPIRDYWVSETSSHFDRLRFIEGDAVPGNKALGDRPCPWSTVRPDYSK